MTTPEYKGYRGDPSLKGLNIPVEWTPDRIEKFIRSANDPIYFSENFVKIRDNEGFNLINFDGRDYQKELILSFKDNPTTIAECARQSGKALPLDTPIPTPNGWATMGSLQMGDSVFDENGQKTKVISTSNVFHNHDCYKITFDDGTTVISDSDHLWAVERANPSKRSIRHKKLTTKELFESDFIKSDSRGKCCSRWKIPLAGYVNYKPQKVDLDPYVLGIWLGDGESASGRLTCHIDDLSFYQKEILFEFSHNHISYNENVYTGTLYGLSKKLRYLNLIQNKHIPKEYLINDIDTRLSILQGLMDSNGTIEQNGRNCLSLSYNRYPQLIEDAHELLLSLGLKVQRKEYTKTNSVRLYFNCPREKFNIFRLPRKLEKQQISNERPWHTNYRFIRNIEKVESVPTKCITVENNSHLFLCSKYFIPTHNSTSFVCYVLWYIIFHQHKGVAILANKELVAMEMLGRIKKAYKALPKWLQQGIVEWNKKYIELENGTFVMAAATSPSSISGFTIDVLIIDEVAKVENWHEFYTASYPTVSERTDSRIILVSTVKGMNHFYDLTQGARKNTNGFHLISVTWRDVPGRDNEWRIQALKGLDNDEEAFAQEYENRYHGSSGTLIAGWKLVELDEDVRDPKAKIGEICIFEEPLKEHIYVLISDVSRGKGLDYSTFQVIDISEMPYKQVATYRNNMIVPTEFAEVVNRIGNYYNTASVLVEINDIGEQVADLLFDDYEYENVLLTHGDGKSGKKITQMWSERVDRGVRTTKTVKATGCAILKLLVEQDQLLLKDFHTIEEFKTFSRKNNSYEAEENKHDDMVMPLVLLAWMTDQDYFKILTDINTLSKIRDRAKEDMENELSSFMLTNFDTGGPTFGPNADMKNDGHWVVVDNFDNYLNHYEPEPDESQEISDSSFIGWTSDR
jgi:hypothetical protein